MLNKVSNGEKLLSLVDKVSDAEKLLELLNTIENVDNAIRLLRVIHNSEDIITLWRNIANVDDIIKLWGEIGKSDDILKLWSQVGNTDEIIRIWKAVGSADEIVRLLQINGMTPSLLADFFKLQNMTKTRLEGFLAMPDMAPARLKTLLTHFGDDVTRLEHILQTTTDNAADLEKLLRSMSPGEIEQFAKEIADLTKFKNLASKFSGDVLQHYGAQFFKEFKGVDSDTMRHLLRFDGITKKKGIKGCHDDAMFLQELLQTPPNVHAPPPGIGRGTIINPPPISHSTNPSIKRYEYSFWAEDGKGNLVTPLTAKAKTYFKTTIRDLVSDSQKWQAIAIEAVEEAIRAKRFPMSDGEFSGISSNGLGWTGWFRNGKVTSIWIDF